jgi:hypothetical protein
MPLYRILIIAFLFDSQAVLSQANTAVPEDPGQQVIPIENSAPIRCVQPAPLFSAADYEGPLKKLVVYFSRKPEITTVHCLVAVDSRCARWTPSKSFACLLKTASSR